MNILTIDHKNGHTSTYKLIVGDKMKKPVAYYIDTPDVLVEVLQRCRRNRIRVRIYYGDPVTGKNWNEEHDIFGYIGLSSGFDARFPILVNNARSMGGDSLSTNRILKIRESKGNRILYQHPLYKPSVFTCLNMEEGNPLFEKGYRYSMFIDGVLYFNHKTNAEMERLKKKMN